MANINVNTTELLEMLDLTPADHNLMLVSGRDVLLNFEKVKDTLAGYELHELSVVNDGIYRYLEVEKVSEKELARVRKNIDAYFDFLSHNKKEAAAHFATLYVSNTYPGAVAFLARECQLLTMSMVIYVKGIKAA